MRLRIGLDIDGVGHIFSAGFKDHLEHTGQGHLWKSGPTPRPYWDWYKDYGWTDAQFVAFCNDAADHGCLFTGHVRDGYKEAMEAIARMGHEIIVITDRAFGSDRTVSEKLTIEWFRDEGMEYDELVFSADKTVVWTDLFVDDKIENYDALTRAGTDAYLINRAWNDELDERQRIDELHEYVAAVKDATDKVQYRNLFSHA